MEDTLPPGLNAYKRTPFFDENTVPPGLRREHLTKDNVRALIHVLEGKLLYRILSPPSAHSLISYQAELEPTELIASGPEGAARCN